MQLFITGSGTLIGNTLSNYFQKKNYKIISSYRKTFPKNLKNKKRIVIKKIDLEKKINIKKKFDTLIHCASAIPDYKLSDKKINKINVLGFKKLLENCARYNCKKIILLSTMDTYGKINVDKINENYVGKNIKAYGKSKKIMEMMLYRFCKKNKINGFIFRLPGVIGKNSKHNFLSNLLNKLIKGEDLEISNPKLKFNNLIHVKNLCILVEKTFKKQGFYVFNVGCKYPMYLISIIKFLRKKVGNKKSKVIISIKKNKGFCINIKKILKHNYNIFSTKKSLSLFIKENI